MERLDDAYGDTPFQGRNPRRVYAGVALGAAGALAVVLAILVVTTPLSDLLGAADLRAAERLAGTLGGLGAPAMFLAVVAVLPSSRREQAGVVAGSAACLVGVWLFRTAYPHSWTTGATTLAFETTMAYFLGVCVAFWFVFRTMARFRVRNNPRDTVRLELTHQGGTKTVEVSPEEYRRYAEAIRSDGGETDEIIRELESRAED